MQISEPRFKKYVFVCENEREEKECCAAKGSPKIRELLKEAVKQKGLASKIRVSRAGCLDSCAEGANILIFPDNVWLKKVTESDIPLILKKLEA